MIPSKKRAAAFRAQAHKALQYVSTSVTTVDVVADEDKMFHDVISGVQNFVEQVPSAVNVTNNSDEIVHNNTFGKWA